METKAKKTFKRKAKKNTGKAQEATSKNVQKNVESKAIARDVKYLYPAEAETKLDRKKFRTAARAKVRSFEKKIAKAENKTEEAKLERELKAYKKEIFTDGVKAEIG